MTLRHIARRSASFSVLVVGLMAGGCAAPTADPVQMVAADPDEWVVVMFEDTDDQFDSGLMDALLDTEMAADAALAEAGAGWIDGNDVGDYSYELYFVGDDATEMWLLLDPIFADAPVAWTRVELRESLEDPSPEVLAQG
ncbi:hypothetical protein [Demequina zhanjiangensis]|uniref:DUF4377 domain-containing protein n=1 Tax=Demequina zhanjiangensis TaxID=3051659 RepID=A0ABT8G520_9MICO|nr:hypothetical protein [Demequina sp. SYSU T00b26]MDN4474213.1 hypothetical protein [Demequina sp. SYSU T00b26]